MCGETRIPRDMCAGKHDTRGNTHPYDTGFHVKENQGTFRRRHQGVQDSAGTELLFQF